MSTKHDFTFRVNGVIDTNKSIIDNMRTLAGTASSWITFDISQGKFAVVINKPGTADWDFNDSNIIGSITVSGTGLTEYYNSIEYDFPNKDIVDQTDTTTFSIPVGQRYPNEPQNTIQFAVDTINDPIVAQYLAAIQLNQSRVDKIVQFRTDFSSLGIVAGDLFSLTSEMYGFNNKIFRVTTVEEEDTDDGNLLLAITGLEYDADVYDTSNLVRTVTETGSGILSSAINTTTTASNNQAAVPIGTNDETAKVGGAVLAFNALTGLYEITQTTPQATLSGVTGIVLNWTFTDGSDLDIRCRMVSPSVFQDDVDDYIGWTDHGDGNTTQWPAANPFLQWGGDNTGTGTESVLFDVNEFRTQWPTKRYAVIECRANWYGTAGYNPVQLTATMYQGGTFSISTFQWTNAGATGGRNLDGLQVYVNSNLTGTPAAYTLGDLMGYFVYDTQNGTGQFTTDYTQYTA